MNKQIPPPISTNKSLLAKSLPAEWKLVVQPQLADAEELHAWLEINLDARLHFTEHLLLLTNQRLLFFDAIQTNGGIKQTSVVEYPYRTGLTLRHHDHAGEVRLSYLMSLCLMGLCA